MNGIVIAYLLEMDQILGPVEPKNNPDPQQVLKAEYRSLWTIIKEHLSLLKPTI
jgi:hypothetical protein